MSDGPKKPRRGRADSIEAAVRDLQTAERVIEPPANLKLDAKERIIFDEVIGELPRGEWSPHTIRLAANLAQHMAMLQQERRLLADEGSVVTAANGSRVGNPRQRSVDSLHRMILASRRSLSLTARAKAGYDNRVLGQRRAIQMGNEGALDDMDDEGLIARPGMSPTDPKRRH